MRISTKGQNAIKLMLDLTTYSVGENGTPCENKSTCVSFRLWEKLDTAINDVLESITLADMLEWQDELLADQYVI